MLDFSNVSIYYYYLHKLLMLNKIDQTRLLGVVGTRDISCVDRAFTTSTRIKLFFIFREDFRS